MYSLSEVITKSAYDILSKDKNWSEKAKTKSLPKEQTGLFTGQNADQIVKGLLKDSKGDVGKAIEKLQFYINRGGEKIPEKEKVVVNRAKKMLEDKLKREKK